jgi:hypothetical protein
MDELALIVAILALPVLLSTAFFVFVPESLRWLASHNKNQHRQARAECEAAYRDLLRAAERLHPYHVMKTDEYRELITAGQNTLRSASDDLKAVEFELQSVDPVTIPPRGLAFEFFVRDPGQTVAIPRTTWRLMGVFNTIGRAKGTIATASREQARLDRLPQDLRSRSHWLRDTRIPQVFDLLQRELETGIQISTDYGMQLETVQDKANYLNDALSHVPQTPSTEADDLAGEVGKLSTAVDQLEQIINAHREARLQLDRNLETARAAHISLATNASGTEPPITFEHLVALVEDLLAEVESLRQQAQFGRAERRTADVMTFIELGEQIRITSLDIHYLKISQSGEFLADEAGQVVARWQELLVRVETVIGIDDINVLLPQQARQTSEIVEELTAEAKVLSADVQQLLVEIDRIVTNLEQEADRQIALLNKASQDLGKTSPVADDDPLAEKYHAIMQYREGAHGNAGQLRQVIVATEQLTSELKELTAEMRKKLVQMNSLIQDLDALATLADNESGNSACLQKYAGAIYAAARRIVELRETVSVQSRFDEKLAALEECRELEEQANAAYAKMSDRLRQLTLLSGTVEHARNDIYLNRGNLSEAAVEGKIHNIDHYFDLALSEMQYDAALLYLEEARVYARP